VSTDPELDHELFLIRRALRSSVRQLALCFFFLGLVAEAATAASIGQNSNPVEHAP